MVWPMRLSKTYIYSSPSLWRGHALTSLRYVTWYKSHGLGLGIDSSNSPTICFFSLGSFLSSTRLVVVLPLHRVARRRAVLPLLCVACRHASAARRLRGPIPRERGFTRGRSLVFASASCAQITRGRGLPASRARPRLRGLASVSHADAAHLLHVILNLQPQAVLVQLPDTEDGVPQRSSKPGCSTTQREDGASPSWP